MNILKSYPDPIYRNRSIRRWILGPSLLAALVFTNAAHASVRPVTEIKPAPAQEAGSGAENPSLPSDTQQSPSTDASLRMREHALSKNSRLLQYIWHLSGKELPDFKVYVYEPENHNGRSVCIDAGHGENSHPAVTQKGEKVYPVSDALLTEMNTSMTGEKAYDYGVEARSFQNVYSNQETEPEYTLRLALLIKDRLLAKGYRVVLTRNDFSQNLSNGARSVLAGETSDLMVSIHTNASGAKGASGTLSFYPGDQDYMGGGFHPGYTKIMGLEGHAADSKRLAELVGQNVAKEAGFMNKGAHSAILRIFSYSSIPTCLVEVGFSDEINDAKLLTEKKSEAADGIIKGIEAYYQYKAGNES